MNRLRARVAGLVLAVTAPAAVLLPLGLANAPPTQAAATSTKQIAVSTLGQDFRATLTAVRGPSEGGAAVATVRVAAYKRSAGEWQLIGRQTVGGKQRLALERSGGRACHLPVLRQRRLSLPDGGPAARVPQHRMLRGDL